jgi:hypothetical protein
VAGWVDTGQGREARIGRGAAESCRCHESMQPTSDALHIVRLQDSYHRACTSIRACPHRRRGCGADRR